MVGPAPAVRAARFFSIRAGEQGSRCAAPGPASIGIVLVVTTDQLPGYEIRQILGEVVSSMARTRNPYREGVKNLRGGAYDPMAPDNLTRWRTDSVARLGEEARRLGANAVVGMRFDSRDCGEMWMEICAYGTAVIVVPKVPDVMPPDQPLVAAETAQEPAFAEEPGKIAEPPSAPTLGTAPETPTRD
ncbi:MULTISPECIES: YbjQ family protein [unclassified Micromonospora]|uniref:YbjQ family protein n=1 Tax=Micromonospora TaxID=1873 RepID=UPI0022B6631E|nr:MULTISPECIES: YbjQ family protein [unclassified Micromonospora]MCZ7421580.1 YbjQ family protein [Verrucosispora sp. WMMA2121]WBB93735.1 YbjQ family protein [Verrucosispora sp. WMMC514]